MRALLEKYGFYLALAGCLTLLGGAAYWARSLPPRLMERVPAATAEPQAVAALVRADESAPEAHLPVEYLSVLAPYNAEPVWSKTLLQWQPHAGVDLEAELGSVVYAVLEGEIAKAYQDDLLGNTVEIAHADGLVTRYRALSTLRLAKVGARVAGGEAIGAVGLTALAESALPPHLHFEAEKDGQWIDLFDFSPAE